MTISRVWIRYKPRLIHDLLQKVFRSHKGVEVLELYQLSPHPARDAGPAEKPVDVILLSLDEQGQPDLELLPFPIAQAKLVAFSPKGDHGMRRMPGESDWEDLQPCGIHQLVQEVLNPG